LIIEKTEIFKDHIKMHTIKPNLSDNSNYHILSMPSSSQTLSNACFRSVIRSSTSSRPSAMRTRLSTIPIERR
jgi:hypothetical protein